jgi:hypothetical protein
MLALLLETEENFHESATFRFALSPSRVAVFGALEYTGFAPLARFLARHEQPQVEQ